jgi:uncharacterized protein
MQEQAQYGGRWILNDDQIKQILSDMNRVAVVGLSPKESRPSHGITRWLIGRGIEVLGVNPAHQEILGLKVYPDLESVPGRVDVVGIFRRSDAVEPIVRDAVKRGDGAIWMQEGVVNQDAAAMAREAGIPVVMDLCLYKEWLRLLNG